VLLVALNHAGIGFLGGGYVGVDVFFVISGYLITGWLLRRAERSGQIPFSDFYAARARRILPAASLTLVATVAAAWYFLNVVRALSAFHDAVWSAVFAANIHFSQVGTNYFAQDNPPSPLQHFWSLAVEEQFYVVWPACLAVALVALGARRRLDSPAVRRRLAALVAVTVLASLAYSVRATDANPTAAYFSAFARAWELGIGALLAVCAADVERIPAGVRAAMSWAGLAGIGVAAVAFSSGTPFPGDAALLPVLSSAAVIAGGLGGDPRGAVAVLALRPMRLTGDVSYAFYLWHWPVLTIAAQHAAHPLSIAENLMLLVIAYAISLITFSLYEYPIRHSTRLRRPRAALVLWPATVGAVVLAAGWAIDSTENATAAYVAPVKAVQKPLPVFLTDVERSVSPARRAQAVPGNLIPQPAELPKTGPTGCVTRTALGKHCVLGDRSARRTVIVFGDSHAAAWLPSVSYSAARLGFRLIPVVKASCTLGVASAAGHCADWYQEALARMRGLHPRAIIVGQYFDPRIPERSMYAGARRELHDFAQIAPEVALMEDPPTHDVNPIDCLLASGATLGSCTFSFTSDLERVHSTMRGLAIAAGADFVPTLRWFCAHRQCPIVVGRFIVYWDTNHMTKTYARHIAVPVTAALRPLLIRRGGT
jgi:peptidoglycan/LPS O-acetylase OafA/YrhL